MAFIDRIVEHPGRYILTNADTGVQLGTFDLVRAEGDVYTDGTLLNANNLNTQTQLDASVQAIYSALETDTSKQNDVSNALYFLVQHAAIKNEYDSGNCWHVREWTNGIVEQWATFDRSGTFTAWSPLGFYDASCPEAQPISTGTIIGRYVGGYCEGTTSWCGELATATTIRFITNGAPAGTKTFHCYIYIIRKV